MWSTCTPMELGPAFSKVLTIKGGGDRPGAQKGGLGGRASCHRSRSFSSSYPRRKIGVAWSATRVPRATILDGSCRSPNRQSANGCARWIGAIGWMESTALSGYARPSAAANAGARLRQAKRSCDALGLPGLDLPKFCPLTLQRRGH